MIAHARKPWKTIIACLLLGAIVNVAVALGFAIKGRWMIDGFLSASTPQPAKAAADVAAVPIVMSGDLNLNTEITGMILRLHLAGPPHAGASSVRLMEFSFECGWPLRSLHGHWEHIIDAASDQTLGTVLMEFRTGLEAGKRLPPLRPLWRGFAINTLFYAAIAFALIAGPFMVLRLRRSARSRRGLCITCGYNLRGLRGCGDDHAVCPECGARHLRCPCLATDATIES